MTKTYDRRAFTRTLARGGLAAATAALALGGSRSLRAQTKARVLVIGGGAGGATAARHLARSGAVAVTLVEPSKTYTTCFFSNLYLGGLRSFPSLTHGYDTLSGGYGVTVVHERAAGIDADRRQVRLAGGVTLPYDRLIVAPGIDFDRAAIDGYDEAATQAMPHAYKAGPQTRLLKAAIEGMPDGGLFIIAPPPNPFRCPPGPYERASMAAHYFMQHKPGAKILILDAKDSHSKQALFEQAWERFYPGMIEWVPAEMSGGGVTGVDAATMTVRTADEQFKADAANIIPAQTAGQIALESGLTDASGWCPIDPSTFGSTLAENIHVVGDAIIAGDMPKSGFSANSQARICANAILADLADKRRHPPGLQNACWSLVAPEHGIKVGASYAAVNGRIEKREGFVSSLEESDETRVATSHEANGWYAAITKDMFG